MTTPYRIAGLGMTIVLLGAIALIAWLWTPGSSTGPDRLSDPEADASTTEAESIARAPRDAEATEHSGEVVAPLPEADVTALTALRDTTTALTQRLQAVQELGRRARHADAGAVATLLAVSGRPGPLVAPAHRALRRVEESLRPAIVAAIRPRLAHREVSVVLAATALLGHIGGAAAIPRLDAILRDNRQRPDGFAQQVREGAARALAQIGDAQAVPTLERELRWIATTAMQSELDYGDEVVEALRSTRTAAAVPALKRYAAALHQARPDYGPVRAAIDTHLAIVSDAITALNPHQPH